MSFFESPRFPDDVSYGAAGGPGYATEVTVLNSGFEARNQVWAFPRARYNVAHGLKTQAQLDTLLAFFHACEGRTHGFRFKDWTDYQCSASAGILTLISGDNYQMYKRYTGGTTKDRKITKPVSGTITIVGGGSYSIDYATGIVTRNSGAVPSGWSGQFDVPCRFDTDQMQVSIPQPDAYSWESIPIIEIRV